MNFRSIVILLGLLLLGACGSHGGWVSRDDSGDISIRLTQDTWMVRYYGNSNNTREHVRDLTLAASAIVTLKSGYKYFVVIKDEMDEIPSYWIESSVGIGILDRGLHSYNKYVSRKIIKLLKNRDEIKKYQENNEIVYNAEIIKSDTNVRSRIAKNQKPLIEY